MGTLEKIGEMNATEFMSECTFLAHFKEIFPYCGLMYYFILCSL